MTEPGNGQGGDDAGGRGRRRRRDGQGDGHGRRDQGRDPKGTGDRAGQSGAGRGGGGDGDRPRGAARERLREERARNRSRGGSGRLLAIIGVVLLVVAVVVIFVVVQNQRTTSTGEGELPDTVASNGGPVTFGTGPVTVSLWEDFQCPVCKAFEATNGQMLKEMADANDITLEIHPVSFLDQNLNNSSSALAANAFGCAAASGSDPALEFHLTVYEHQPEEQPGVEAWSAADLVGWGDESGISGSDWATCVNDQPFSGWVADVESSRADAGVVGTPTVFVDGELAWKTKEEFPAFLQSSDALAAVINQAGS
ncbi:MAG TPA: thioredoxin domain-containing protein [Actinomycetes bacterium]|nr:thioredoxin domain-containing protein [Actinomycetes bacterium]